MNYEDFFQDSIDTIKEDGRYRTFATIERLCGKLPFAMVELAGLKQEALLWCGNDYLGMGQHQEVLKTMSDVILENGAGAGGTRNISGTSPYHTLLERELSSWHKTDSALVFTSGYVANETALSTLASRIPDCIVLSDALNHASMIEGISHSRARKFIFRHNDMKQLKEFLEQLPKHQPKIIAVESIYSMEGSIAPLEEILQLAKKYSALTYIDEVHAVGLYGAQGAGKIQELGLEGQFDIVQGTLGKAVGVIGGYIAGSKAIIDFVRSFAPGFIFTTSLPPSIVAGALKSIQILRTADALRRKHQEVVLATKEAFHKEKLRLIENTTHIIPLLIGDAKKCCQLSQSLFKEFGLYVQPINAPTVPKGTERFRITPTPHHSLEDIHKFTHALSSLIKS